MDNQHHHQLFCSVERKSLQLLSDDLNLGIKLSSTDSRVVSGLAVFVDVEWLLDRERLFKAYVVQSPSNSCCDLFTIALPTATASSNPSLRRAFLQFEQSTMSPVSIPKSLGGGIVFAMDLAMHLGNTSSSVRINTATSTSTTTTNNTKNSTFEDQLNALMLNVNLHRLGGCIPDKRAAWSLNPVSDTVRDRFYNTMGIKNGGSGGGTGYINDTPTTATAAAAAGSTTNSGGAVSPSSSRINSSNSRSLTALGDSVRSLGKLIQRNLYLLALYPLEQPLLGPWKEDVWIDGLICNTTILGMTEFVSEFGPFDAPSLHTLSEYSILNASLISILFKTTHQFRYTLTALGYPPKTTTTAATPHHHPSSTTSGGGVNAGGNSAAGSGGAPGSNSITDASYSQHFQHIHIGDWKDFQRCIRELQKDYGLSVTGTLNPATRRKVYVLMRELNPKGGGAGVAGGVGAGGLVLGGGGVMIGGGLGGGGGGDGDDFVGSMGGGGVSGFGGGSGGGGGGGGAVGGGDPLHSNQFLILGQQSAQRGMDRVVGGGNGGAVGVVTGDKGGTPGIKRSGVGGVDGDELGIDWFLQVAKGVEEGHKAFEERERIKLEKRNIKELKTKMRKQRSGASPTRMLRQNSIGRVVGTTGAMGVMVGLANPGLLSVSVLKKAGEPKSAEIIHDSATKKSPVAGQPPSPGLLVPTVQLTASASNRSLLSPNRMSPIPSSGDEESGQEERTSPQRSNTNTSNAPQGQKILQGFKNLGRNVKRFANLGGGNNSGGANSLSKTSRDILDTSQPEEPLNTRASTSGARLPRVSDASMRDPLAVKTRSFSVGDLTTPPVSAIASALPDHDTSSSPNSSVNAEDESGKPKISIEPFLDNSIATVPPFLRRSRSESQLHSQQSHSSLAPSSRQSHSRQSLVSENGTSGGGGFGAGKPSDGSLRSSRRSNTKNVKRSVTKRKLHVAAASSLRGTKSKVNLSPVDAAGIGAGNISDGVVDASDIEVLPSKETIERLQQKRRILETSTDIPELIEAITERLATLRNHPKINSQVSNPLNADTSQASASDSATAMSGSRITPILQSIDATYSQLAILQSQSIPTTTTLPLEEQSIHQVQEHLSSLTERIQSAIQTRSEHKTKLLSELKTLVHTQKETVGQIDALNTQTMKLKYAVGLLEGRVMETEEAARVFVSRVQNVETRLKDGWGGGATEGGLGWFGWIFGRRG